MTTALFTGALRALERDARGQLPRAVRREVWLALERPARARLALAAAERSLSVWEAAWPEDDLPHQLLELAGGVSAGELEPDAEETATQLDDLSTMSANKTAVAAGYAALEALRVAARDELLDEADATDETSSPELKDAAWLASVAIAGGPPWSAGADAERRRAFWRWWLEEARGLTTSS